MMRAKNNINEVHKCRRHVIAVASVVAITLTMLRTTSSKNPDSATPAATCCPTDLKFGGAVSRGGTSGGVGANGLLT
jgi:hypothetical protein